MAEKFKVRDEIIDLATFDLSVVNVDKQISNAASIISRAAALWAEAQMQADEVDAEYRHWRAQFAKSLIEKDPKMAEHKIKTEIEADSKFLALKKAHAACKRNALTLKGLVGSLEIRAGLLQTKGANQRAELDKTGIVTRESITPRERVIDASSRSGDIRGIIGGGKGPARPKDDGADEDDGDAPDADDD